MTIGLETYTNCITRTFCLFSLGVSSDGRPCVSVNIDQLARVWERARGGRGRGRPIRVITTQRHRDARLTTHLQAGYD